MHFLTKTFGRLHLKGSHARKFNIKDKRIEEQFYYKHVPKYGSLKYLKAFSFDSKL